MSSVFSKIIAGEIPSMKVYENDHVLAFLDISPVCKGHTLVIPKKEVQHIWDLDDSSATELLKGVRDVSDLLVSNLEADGINVFSSSGEAAGQTVMHLHFHLLPRYKDDGLQTNIHENPVLKIDLEELHNEIIG